MKNYYFGLSLLISFVVIISSCNKEKDNVKPCPLNLANIAGVYQLTSMKYKANATATEQDFLMFMDACERDDIITLNANGTYGYQDAGVVCNPDASDSGTWSLNGNIVTSDGVVNGTIDFFDCKTLSFYVTSMITPGDRLTITIRK